MNATHAVAAQFSWPFGKKSIIARETNQGLVKQWYFSWIPTSEKEAAFVFEDDLEVSPYFFKWTYRAVRKYYSTSQRAIHRQLLLAVRDQMKLSPPEVMKQKYNKKQTEEAEVSSTDSIDSIDVSSVLDRFARDFSGKPVMYGICLQKQHLDPVRYPKRLSVRNGYRPFLYR